MKIKTSRDKLSTTEDWLLTVYQFLENYGEVVAELGMGNNRSIKGRKSPDGTITIEIKPSS